MNSSPDEREHERRRRTARHLRFTLAAAALFGVAILAVAWTSRHSEPISPTTSPAASPSATATLPTTQPTLLIQATGTSGQVGNLLTGLGGSPGAASLVSVVPGNLVVSAPGVSSRPLSQTQSVLDPRLPESAVAATLGVRVDGSWRIDRKALAGLVDSVGGVTVNVPRRTRVIDGEDVVVLSLRKGTQALTGAQASWYAVGDVRRGTDVDAMSRFSAVMLPTLKNLPASDADLRETLTSLGWLAPATVATSDLATYLVGLADALRVGNVRTFTVPSTPVALRERTLRWVRYDLATPLFRDGLPLAQWQAGDSLQPRVLVMTGSTRPGLIASTRSKIESGGYVFVDGRGTPAPATELSTVQARGPKSWAKRTAQLLGLPGGSVRSSQSKSASGQPWADVDVNLGEDYVPSSARVG
ncbi:MAG: LCP family protein [Candidatus Nanopelagicales bacterium]|nr:LCP family protein [Candidatus Nanopelagicales bacterium]MDZ4250490.1 LCP family protein [Candidatus Nanopelagicales bacterium]